MKKLILLGLLLLFITPVFAQNDKDTTKSIKQTAAKAINSPALGPYMRALATKIKSNWHPSKGNQAKSVTTLFTIQKNGEITNIRIIKSSDIKEMDDAAIEAIKKASPFEPLPKEYKENKVDIDFTFNYNILDVGSQKSLKEYSYNKKQQVYNFDYRNKVYNKIVAETWKPVSFAIDPYTKNNIVAQVTINKNGELVDYKITHSKGKKADEAAINAIKKAAPFEPFPSEMTAETDTFTINFNYSKAKNRK